MKLKQKTKERLRKYGYLIACLLISTFIYFNYYIDKKQLINQLSNVEQKLNIAEKQSVVWRDKYNVEHRTVEKIRVDYQVLEVEYAEQAKLLGIKPKQIQGQTIVTTETIFEKQFDTVYRDNYVYLEKDSNSVKVEMYDTLVFTDYWKRVGFLGLGGKRYFKDVSNRNPYIRLTGLKTIEAKPKNPTVIIGPSFGYDAITNRPTIGVSLIWYPGSIKL